MDAQRFLFAPNFLRFLVDPLLERRKVPRVRAVEIPRLWGPGIERSAAACCVAAEGPVPRAAALQIKPE